MSSWVQIIIALLSNKKILWGYCSGRCYPIQKMNSPRKLQLVLDTINPNWFCPWSPFCCNKFPITLRIAFEKMKLFKMHRIIKPTCPSRQLFIKITFVFMKIFDILVKIAIFCAFLFRSRDSSHSLLPGSIVGFGQ